MNSALSSATFSVEEVSEVDPDFPAANIIVGVAADIETDEFKPLMKIYSLTKLNANIMRPFVSECFPVYMC